LGVIKEKNDDETLNAIVIIIIRYVCAVERYTVINREWVALPTGHLIAASKTFFQFYQQRIVLNS
jgi:hypothetical protein